jgi:hypothetical protein
VVSIDPSITNVRRLQRPQNDFISAKQTAPFWQGIFRALPPGHHQSLQDIINSSTSTTWAIAGYETTNRNDLRLARLYKRGKNVTDQNLLASIERALERDAENILTHIKMEDVDEDEEEEKGAHEPNQPADHAAAPAAVPAQIAVAPPAAPAQPPVAELPSFQSELARQLEQQASMDD